ncbi:MAG: hypothetical protein GF350_17370 [Chitinivibrionales bacterium]|nr:hypothetical protein [Chitinivibrionales bacterium]
MKVLLTGASGLPDRPLFTKLTNTISCAVNERRCIQPADTASQKTP